MPKYFDFKVCGYYLYFTSKCIVECMHVHASDTNLTEESSAKLFVKENGDSIVQNKGILKEKELNRIKAFIKKNYMAMYEKWVAISDKGFYRGK